MKTMFLKELRENAKWAAVIFGAFGVLVYFQIREPQPDFLFDLTHPQTTLLPVALAGLLMGLAQGLFETRADNWSFVVHRPVSRLAIFTAKCAAGLLLLYVSLGVPCVLAVAWAAKPGSLPFPFQWRMVLPLAADVLNVGPFYFAGMILTLRKARWFGSRLLPLGLAIGCTVAVRFCAPEFWQAALFSLAGMGVGALAAWNVFSTAGVADQGRAPCFALGTMIYAGALGVGCFLVAFLGVLQGKAIWHDLRVDRDGNIRLITWTLENNERTCIVADADGRPLRDYEGIDIDEKNGEGADRFVRFSNGSIDEQRAHVPWLWEAESFGYRTPTPGVVLLKTISTPGTKLRRICLFDVPERIIDEYDPITHVLMGRVGPSGLSPGETPPSERFPGKSLNPMAQGGTHTLTFPSAVYWMELDQHRVRQIFTAPADDPVVAATELPPLTDPTVVVVTRNHLHVLQPSGKSLFSAPLDLDLSKYWFTLGLIPSNHHVVLQAMPILAEFAADYPSQFLEFGTDGQLVRRIKPPQIPDDRPPTVLQRTALMGFVYPLGGLPLFSSWVMDSVFELDSQRNWWLFHGCMFASSILCAAATLLLARRCGFSGVKAISWSAANALLGPAGIVVMLSLNDWPAREACAACGGKRLAGRRECSRCGKPLPPPNFDGREIFEPADAFQPAA